MTVQELIDQLSKLDPNLQVYRVNYYYPYQEIIKIKLDKITTNKIVVLE